MAGRVNHPFPCRLATCCLVFVAAAVRGQLAPEVGYVFPAGGRAGTTVEVKLGGYEWTPDMQFFVHDPRVKLEVLGPPGDLLLPPPPYWFGARGKAPAVPIPREVPARFVLPAGLPPGLVRWQAANANGATATGTFLIGTGPEVVEQEGCKGPQVLPGLPVTISGRLLKNEEVDRYRFTARAAGPVTCVLTARRLGASFHGVLEVRDAEGRPVAEAVDTEGTDPALTFPARAGADYTVSVRDIDHAGDRSYVYRLALTPGPRVVAALPAAGRRGETRQVEFVGVGVATGGDRLESTTRQVPFRADPGLSSFAYRLETAWGPAPPFDLLLSDVPEGVAENIAGKPAALAVPGAVTAVLGGSQAENCHLLMGKKGERWAVAVEARRLGSPLDVTLAVRGPDGKELARNDDLPGTTDAGLEFTVPADGTYTLAVGDTAGTAGTRAAVYRLVVSLPADDFTLTTPTQRLGVHLGDKAALKVKAVRAGNFKGPIRMAASGLPPGVKVPAVLVIPAEKAELDIALEAAADAPAAASLVTIVGTAEVHGKRVTRPVEAVAAGSLAPAAPEENHTATLVVATTLKPRCKGAVVDRDTGRKVPRGSTFPADVVVERLEGFRGEIVLKMASRQSYQVQGISGRDVVVPPGVTHPFFPCYMPEWLETSRTSRMGIIAEVKAADPRGTVRHCVAPVEGFVTMTMEGALLKVGHEGRDLVTRAGQSVVVRVRVARSPRLPEPVRLELVPDGELHGLLRANPLIVPPGQGEADFVITTTAGPALAGEHVLRIRGTALQPGNLPVISETAVPVTFLAEKK